MPNLNKIIFILTLLLSLSVKAETDDPHYAAVKWSVNFFPVREDTDLVIHPTFGLMTLVSKGKYKGLQDIVQYDNKGVEKWNSNLAGSHDFYHLGVNADGYLYAVEHGAIYKINPKGQNEKISLGYDYQFGQNGDLIVVEYRSDDNAVIVSKIDRANKLVWHKKYSDKNLNPKKIVVGSGFVFIINANDKNPKNTLIILDDKTGEELYQLEDDLIAVDVVMDTKNHAYFAMKARDGYHRSIYSFNLKSMRFDWKTAIEFQGYQKADGVMTLWLEPDEKKILFNVTSNSRYGEVSTDGKFLWESYLGYSVWGQYVPPFYTASHVYYVDDCGDTEAIDTECTVIEYSQDPTLGKLKQGFSVQVPVINEHSPTISVDEKTNTLYANYDESIFAFDLSKINRTKSFN